MLEQSIAQSVAITDSAFIAIVLVKDRHIVWANAAMHRIFGYQPDELIGHPTRNLFLDQESYEAFGKAAYPAIARHGAYTGIIPQKRKDGTTGWYEFNLSPLANHPDTVVGAIVDRTASYDRLLQLEESESRYRTVVEDQTEVISRFLPDGKFLFTNEVFCRTFGKSTDELIGQRWQPGVAHPDDVSMIEGKLREMSPDNPVITIENRVMAANGEIRWMQFVNRGFYDAAGTLKEIQSVGRDITPLKLIEAKLLQSEEQLDMALAGSDLALWDWDIAKREVKPGRRWIDILGFTNHELGVKEDDWFGLVHPLDLENAQKAIAAHFAGDTERYRIETRMRHKEGHWVMLQVTGKVTHRDEAGTPLRMVGTVQNITQRKRLNEEGIDLLRRIESLIQATTSVTPATPPDSTPLASLTKRERQVLGMVAGGLSTAQIGVHLNLSANTIANHRQKMMAKLNLHNMAEVTRFAIDHGLMNQN